MTFLAGKRIAITGGGGSVGSELALRIIGHMPRALLLIDNSEVALWRQMVRFEGLPVECRLGDVRDFGRMLELFEDSLPDIVFHAAALKHVPFCERDEEEAERTNRCGTGNVAVAASDMGASVVVLISTDKAADPIGVLGRTKAAAEDIMSRLNLEEGMKCRFASVRFHNVFGSSGSVVHRFSQQIAMGGPVTVTHADMTRWFATPREASDLLIKCAEHAAGPNGRDLYALSIGKPMKILDLARGMIGDKNVEISFIGLRPGERLNEKLVGDKERSVDVGIDGVIGVEKIPDEASGPAGGSTGGEECPAEGKAPKPEAA